MSSKDETLPESSGAMKACDNIKLKTVMNVKTCKCSGHPITPLITPGAYRRTKLKYIFLKTVKYHL